MRTVRQLALPLWLETVNASGSPKRGGLRSGLYPYAYLVVGDHFLREIHAFGEWDLHPLLGSLCKKRKRKS